MDKTPETGNKSQSEMFSYEYLITMFLSAPILMIFSEIKKWKILRRLKTFFGVNQGNLNTPSYFTNFFQFST